MLVFMVSGIFPASQTTFEILKIILATVDAGEASLLTNFQISFLYLDIGSTIPSEVLGKVLEMCLPDFEFSLTIC
ncbi:hypothetical protein AYI68_g3306 [Smittium mucronatum]|uniref:Uncharacterized protein n=1 Tax=Smittium mucronatum TaxID=133383 RepID=A0A1R0H0B2_9FUNG|nr:hypothetical protein AYI68_g3306 [Smittium mucronatum]